MNLAVAGRVAFITGGANGIGLGVARALAAAGAKIALADIDADGLQRAQDELKQVVAAKAFVLDVRDRDGFERVARDVEQSLGPVSLLLNNAGVAGGAPVNTLTYELWDWAIGINLIGVVNGIQTFLPRMIARGGGGHIVHTASGAGLATTGNSGVLYQTTKYGVVGMAEALAAELAAYDIGVSVLCPGPVATGIIKRTRDMQPSVTRVMTADQLQAARAESARMKVTLAEGVPPDRVGEMVLDAIRRRRLYIHTDRVMAPFIKARTKALLDAMPRAPNAVAGDVEA